MERSFMSSEMQAYADFSQTEEGDVKGVIVKGGTVGGAGGGPAGPGMFKAYYAFNVDKSENLYCEKLLSAEKISFGEPGSIVAAANQDVIITGPTAAIKPIVGDTLTADELSSNGLSTALNVYQLLRVQKRNQCGNMESILKLELSILVRPIQKGTISNL